MSKGDRSGDVEQVGGQDRCGWTFARSLSKHTLKVYSTLTPSEALEYRASKRHRKHPSWPRGHRKAVQVGGIGAGAARARRNLPDGQEWGQRSRQKEQLPIIHFSQQTC